MKHAIFFLLTFFLVADPSESVAQHVSVIKDLHNDWKVYEGDKYVNFENDGEPVSTVYFSLEAAAFPEMELYVNSSSAHSVLVNGKLAARGAGAVRLSIDSLSKAHNSPLLQVSVHQREIHQDGLQTMVVSKKIRSEFSELLSPHYSAFRDFAIIGIMVLLIMLIVITQLNPKLASDYFSVTKIFSMREGEDGQSYSRITSSINILFYAYSSLMMGYYLIIIYHFLPKDYPTALFFQATTFWGVVLQWAELSLIVLVVFFLKIVMVYGLSYVFGMKEIGGVHFFNWVRLLVGVFGVLTVVLFLYFISHGSRPGFYDFLLGIVTWVFAGWMVLIILKLQRHLQHSMFHLFSYICATELIPFLITIKVLYY